MTDLSLAESSFGSALQDPTLLAALAETLNTSTGTIKFYEGIAVRYSFADALIRLHDLHLRCLGEAAVIKLDEDLTPQQARPLYRVAASALMLQTANSGPDAAMPILETAEAVALNLGKTDGLDPVFVTALLLSPSAAMDDETVRLLNNWIELGIPAKAGGDAGISIGFSHKQGFVKFDWERAAKIARGDMARDQLFARGDRYSMSNQQCKGWWKLGGLVGGGAIGSFGGFPGAATGAGVGYAAGDAVGDIHCRDDKSRQKENEDKDDDDDKPGPDDPERGETKAGCILNPAWGDLARGSDPYQRFSRKQTIVAVPYGKGIRSFIVRDSLGRNSVIGMPRGDLRNIGKGRKGENIGRTDVAPGFMTQEGGGSGARHDFLESSSKIQSAATRSELQREASLSGAQYFVSSETNLNGLKMEKAGATPNSSSVAVPNLENNKNKVPQYTVETQTRAYTRVDAGVDGTEEEVIESVEYTIHFSPGTNAWLIFGPTVTGRVAETLAANPTIIQMINKGGSAVDPVSPGHLNRGIGHDISRGRPR